jgi:hypothetical protein
MEDPFGDDDIMTDAAAPPNEADEQAALLRELIANGLSEREAAIQIASLQNWAANGYPDTLEDASFALSEPESVVDNADAAAAIQELINMGISDEAAHCTVMHLLQQPQDPPAKTVLFKPAPPPDPNSPRNFLIGIRADCPTYRADTPSSLGRIRKGYYLVRFHVPDPPAEGNKLNHFLSALAAQFEQLQKASPNETLKLFPYEPSSSAPAISKMKKITDLTSPSKIRDYF